MITACGQVPDTVPNDGSLRFSHAIHLTQADIECIDCHTGIMTSAAAEDNNLPREADCLVCHTDAPETPSHECRTCHLDPNHARPLENRERIIHFPHDKHVVMDFLPAVLMSAMDAGVYPEDVSAIRPQITGSNVCEACHRGIRQAGFTTRDNRPLMSDCLVCHASTPPEDGCRFCHPAEIDLLPAGHREPAFFDAHAGLKGENPELCAQCHSSGNNPCTQCH